MDLCGFRGYADLVQTDVNNEHFIGAAWNDAVVAEASATIWAGLYALAHHHFDTITFCFDALGVGQAAAGNFNYKEKYHIVHSARHVMQAVESKWGINAVYYEHVKSHRNHPANELVDTLATEVARLWLVPRAPQLSLGLLFTDQKLLANLWISSQPSFDESWPNFEENSFIGPSRSQLTPLDVTQDWTFGYGQAVQISHASEIHMDLRVHSHNVQSLKGKVLYYRAQAHDFKIPLVALQETSNSEPRVTRADGYMRIAGASKKGHGGVEIWLAENYPVAWKGQRPIYWNLAGTTVLHSDARLMLVVATIPELGQLLLVCGHAPHSGSDAAVQDAWWDLLDTLLRQHRRGRPMIAMLDA